MVQSAQQTTPEKTSSEKNPYFIAYDDVPSGYNSAAFNEYLRKFQAILIKIWPYINRMLNFIVFDGLRFMKSFIKYALRQIGILK